MKPSVPTAIDLAMCASEPIRVPGAIQPHGWLAAIHASDARLAALSDNWGSLLEVPPAQLPQAVTDAVRQVPLAIGKLVVGEGPVSCGAIELAGRRLHVSAHRTAEHVTLEFENDVNDPGCHAPIYSLARHLLPQMQQIASVDALCKVAATEMKRVTAFGRCLVYRFDGNGHGEVLAEAIDGGYDSYDDHHFPGSDIPPQARALYLVNHFRLIADANYTPVPVRFIDAGTNVADFDMTQAALRSVSPVHLEYMRNMRTLASMSVSIIVRGRLWGLISCHDHAPRHLPFQMRVACEHLGQLLSLQIEAKEENQLVSEQLKLRQLTLDMVANLAESDATLQRLVDEPGPLLRMGRASGAAVILNDECWTVGTVPARDHILQLGGWLANRIDDVLHTDQLASQFDAFAGQIHLAAGILAISISRLHQHYIVWFRPEIVQTIQWAGDPRKENATDEQGRLHPRLSFSTWREDVRGRSLPWSAAEANAALELRQALIGIVLRRAEEMAEVATELGRVNKELEAFSYTVSHDLRAPMRHIAGFVDLVLESEGAALSERSRRYLAHVKEASAHSGQLVDALLDFSRMGRSSLKRSMVDTAQLVDDLVAETSSHDAGRRIEWTIDKPLPDMYGDPILIQVAIRNLISNAVKYSRPREVARIAVGGIRSDAATGISVSDNGVGFQMKYVDKLFGVFQRLHQTEAFEGTGIGLASVRRIVERHGGTVTAWGEPDVGAKFVFTLPTKEAAIDEPPSQPISQRA